MHRTLMIVALVAVLAPAPGAADPALRFGTRLRLATTSPQEDSIGADSTRVVREDANSFTLAPAPGEGPVTWTKENRWLIGRIVAMNERHLTLQVDGGARRVIVRRDAIASLAVSEWRRTRGRSALIGAGVGAGAGALIGFASGDDSPGSFFALTAGEKALIMGVVLIPVGALVGLLVPPAERWEEVSTERIRLSLAPVRGSDVAVSLRLAF